MSKPVYITLTEIAGSVEHRKIVPLYDGPPAEASGPNTTTSTAFQTKLTHPTLTREGKWIVFYSCRVNNTGFDGQVRLRDETDNVTLVNTEVYNTPSGERRVVTGFAFMDLDGESRDVSIQIKDVAGGNLQTIRDMRIYYVKYDD